MSERYEPELGQAIFGQPYKEFAVPAVMEAALDAISHAYGIAYWNAKQEQCPSPFSNSGQSLVTPVFQVHAYSWADEEQPFNFKWRDLEISWYKYVGRGMSSNMEITPDMAAKCLDECLAHIRKMGEAKFEGDEFPTYPNFVDLT